MSIEKYYPQFKECRQKEEAACENMCPFHLNVFDFQDKMKRHKFDRAYKDYKNAVAFPNIVAALCPEYCNSVCPRKDFDGAVQLNLLEKTCVSKAKRKDPSIYNVPRKEGRIGIIGGGISGLACALKLVEKNYDVTVFEKEDKIGGQLKGILPTEVYMEDIERQFGKLEYELKTNTEIKNLDEIKEYDFNCVYVATGLNGNDFHTLSQDNGHCYMMDEAAVFGGGSLRGKDVVGSIADGLDMAWACEIFLKTERLEYPHPRTASKVVPDIEKFIPCEPVIPTGNGVLTDEETEIEAGRCIRCQCDACMTYCDIVEFHDQWPVPMREDVAATVASSESMIHKTPAIRVINTCTRCGLFEELCPADIRLGDVMSEARKLLHKQGKMPPAYHGFWLDDMDYSNSDISKICKMAPEKNTCTYAFFPGCNLGAADPEYVKAPYKWLLDNFDDMGLLLRCCGVPADWSGNEKIHDARVEDLRQDWKGLGRPVLVIACPSCKRYIDKYLPEIETVSIYELMNKYNKWPKAPAVIAKFIEEKAFAVFDPCSARNDEEMKQAVRTAAGKVDFSITELPNRDKHGCCGFGGNVEVASPEFADFVAQKRAALSSDPYLTYCVNCRDVFLDAGKPVLHIFDVLFNIKDLDEKAPDLTKRRDNRYDLKKELLMECWGEEMTEERKKYRFDVEISSDILEKMDDLKLVKEDIKEVIDKSIKLNRRTYDKEKDEYICYAKLNYITCWVRYKEEGDICRIINVYTHRMDIELEAVWNGRKVDTDM